MIYDSLTKSYRVVHNVFIIVKSKYDFVRNVRSKAGETQCNHLFNNCNQMCRYSTKLLPSHDINYSLACHNENVFIICNEHDFCVYRFLSFMQPMDLAEVSSSNFAWRKQRNLIFWPLQILQKQLLGLEESHADQWVNKLNKSEHLCKSYGFLKLKTQYFKILFFYHCSQWMRLTLISTHRWTD